MANNETYLWTFAPDSIERVSFTIQNPIEYKGVMNVLSPEYFYKNLFVFPPYLRKLVRCVVTGTAETCTDLNNPLVQLKDLYDEWVLDKPLSAVKDDGPVHVDRSHISHDAPDSFSQVIYNETQALQKVLEAPNVHDFLEKEVLLDVDKVGDGKTGKVMTVAKYMGLIVDVYATMFRHRFNNYAILLNPESQEKMHKFLTELMALIIEKYFEYGEGVTYESVFEAVKPEVTTFLASESFKPALVIRSSDNVTETDMEYLRKHKLDKAYDLLTEHTNSVSLVFIDSSLADDNAYVGNHKLLAFYTEGIKETTDPDTHPDAPLQIEGPHAEPHDSDADADADADAPHPDQGPQHYDAEKLRGRVYGTDEHPTLRKHLDDDHLESNRALQGISRQCVESGDKYVYHDFIELKLANCADLEYARLFRKFIQKYMKKRADGECTEEEFERIVKQFNQWKQKKATTCEVKPELIYRNNIGDRL